MNELPIDYFRNNNEVFAWDDFGDLPIAQGFEDNIRHAISNIQSSHIALGYALIAYAESHTFGFNFGSGYRDCRVSTFFEKCGEKFNLDKSSVSRHVNVVYRFGDGKDGLRSSFRDKSFSYLVELLPLSEQEIDDCLIHCATVADIRKYKAENKAEDVFKVCRELSALVQSCGSNNMDNSVATSQQDKTEKAFNSALPIPLSSLANEYTDYDCLRGMSVKTLCDLYLDSCRVVKHLREELDKYKAIAADTSNEAPVPSAAPGDLNILLKAATV